jgi:hypothetical protein
MKHSQAAYILLDGLVGAHDVFNKPILTELDRSFGRDKVFLVVIPETTVLMNTFFKEQLSGKQLANLYYDFTRKCRDLFAVKWSDEIHSRNLITTGVNPRFEDECDHAAYMALNAKQNLLNIYERRNINLDIALRTDLSICTKCSLVDRLNTTRENFLRLMLMHYVIVLEALYSKCATGDLYVIHNNVYGVNLVIHQFFQIMGATQRFVEPDPDNLTTIKIYEDPFIDAVQRREHFKSMPALRSLSESTKYAANYIQRRIIDKSPFSYSPKTRSQHPSVLDAVCGTRRASVPVVTFFTNSPDEEISSDLAYEYFNRVRARRLQTSRIVDSELESLKRAAMVCKRLGCNLVVRLHPRLSSEHRSNFVSDQLEPFISGVAGIKDAMVSWGSGTFVPEIYLINPDAEINSYRLAQESAFSITSRGSMPFELGLLNLPVVGIRSDLYRIHAWSTMLFELANSFQYFEQNPTGGIPVFTPESQGILISEFWFYRSFGTVCFGKELPDNDSGTYTTSFLQSIELGSSLFTHTSEDNFQANFYSNQTEVSNLVSYQKWLTDFAMPAIRQL